MDGPIKVQSRLGELERPGLATCRLPLFTKKPSIHKASTLIIDLFQVIDLLPGHNSDLLVMLGQLSGLIEWATQNAGFGTLPFHLENFQSGNRIYSSPCHCFRDFFQPLKFQGRTKLFSWWSNRLRLSFSKNFDIACNHLHRPPASRLLWYSTCIDAKLPQSTLARLKYSKPGLETPGIGVICRLYQQLP